MNSFRFIFAFVFLLLAPFILSAASLKQHKNYVFNLTGTQHVYGDVTGPLYTMLDMKRNSQDKNINYIAVVDKRSKDIIEKIFERRIEELGLEYGIQFYNDYDSSKIPKSDMSFELFFGGR